MGVRQIISDAEVEILRGAYNPAIMVHVATTLTTANYTESKGLFDWLGTTHYALTPPDGEPRAGMTDVQRERVLIALFAAGRRPPFALAAHVYWGIMEGMSVHEVADTIMLAASYSGVDVFADSMFTLRETLTIMKHFANKLGAEATPVVVLTSIVNGFRAQPSKAFT